MLNKKLSFFSVLFLFTTLLLFTQCSKDDDTTGATGEFSLEITDAPIDNANVKGAFVTIAEVKIDGQTFSGFQGKQTIDLMAYQNGQVKSLGIAELEASSYSTITLVLDQQEDASGSQPGCYILTDNNEKNDLNLTSNASNEITFSSDDLRVEEGSKNTVVIDFDLRKAITSESNSTETDYKFVTTAELNAAIRTASKENTGVVRGKVTGNGQFAEKTVVYAYKKGTYSKSTEMSGQGSSNVEFSNAVVSATVDASGNYELHFLEEGEYELHYIAYEDTDNDGRIELKGSLSVDIIGSLNLSAVNVNANASVTVDVTATGIIPL